MFMITKNKKKELGFELKTRRDEILTYFRALFHKSIPAGSKFIIFANYRTGSSVLGNLLNCHPEVTCDGEIFLEFLQYLNFKKVLFPHLYMKGIHIGCKTSTYGCSVKLDEVNKVLGIIHGSPKQFMVNLNENGWKIVHLKRLNLLRQAISNITAHERNQWHNTPERPLNRIKIYIDCDRLINTLRWMVRDAAKEEEVLSGIPHMTLVYENDLLNTKQHQITSDSVFNYLGLPPVAVETSMRRTSSDKLSDFVLNYEEVAKLITNTEYARYLEES